MDSPPVTDGLVVVDKPAGLTSHDVVGRLRRILRTSRIGHAGTLDPMATGVLVCGVGRATKLLGHLALDTKAYRATIRLGVATDTDDTDGEIIFRSDVAHVAEDEIRAGIAALTGEIEQVPAAVSAIKVGGRRAYRRARAGERLQLPARRVTVTAFELAELRCGEGLTDLDVAVQCSSGTYVRALARDLGAALGVGGHLTALRRTRVGPFTLAAARTLDELASDPRPLLTLDEAVTTAFGNRRDLDAEQARVLAHGGRLPPAGIAGTHGAFGPDGRVIALLVERDDAARPVVVLRPGASRRS